MFGPYRTPPELSQAEPSRPQEEIILGWALVGLGGLRVAVALIMAEVWGAEATVAGLMVPCGIRLLMRRAQR